MTTGRTGRVKCSCALLVAILYAFAIKNILDILATISDGFKPACRWRVSDMLNVDKYRKEIDLIIEKGAMPRHGILRMCLEETNSESVDAAAALDWLFSEYELPLLEIGDGLKPGDWIMVRDSDKEKWVKRIFICFFEEVFWTIPNIECSVAPNMLITERKQARLPMEGE